MHDLNIIWMMLTFFIIIFILMLPLSKIIMKMSLWVLVVIYLFIWFFIDPSNIWVFMAMLASIMWILIEDN